MNFCLYHRERETVIGLLLGAVALISAGTGCQRRQAAVPPVVIVPSTPESSSPKPVPPDIKPATTANNKPIFPDAAPPPAPPKKKHVRKKTSPPVTASPDATTIPTVTPVPSPQISAQVPPAQQAEIERKAMEEMAETQQEMTKIQGHKLSSGQRDTAEKIRSFLSQASDAAKASDWTLAGNLADKAHVLLEDLVRSF
jgi:hypothetical protein